MIKCHCKDLITYDEGERYMKKVVLGILMLSLVMPLAACGEDASGGEESLTMGFVPSRDAEEIATSVEPLEAKLSEVLGVPVKADVMTNYTALIEGMRTGKIDIGFLAPLNYVLAEKRANVQLLLKSERYGSDSYRAQYSVSAELYNQGIQTIEDLVKTEGLRWGYGDPGSTSGYLFPASQLMDMGVENLSEHFVQTETGGHDKSIIAVYNGDVDFVTTFEDARTTIEEDYPDVMDKVKVIGYTDPIPNDTISVQEGLSDDMAQKIKDAFLSFNEDEEMMQVMNEVYQWTGIVEADPKDYDIVRSTFEKFKDQLEE